MCKREGNFLLAKERDASRLLHSVVSPVVTFKFIHDISVTFASIECTPSTIRFARNANERKEVRRAVFYLCRDQKFDYEW